MADGIRLWFFLASIVGTILLYALGAYIHLLVARRQGECVERSIRGYLAYAFPRALYTSKTSRLDFWNFWIANFLVFPVLGVILGLFGTMLSAEATASFLANLMRYHPTAVHYQPGLIGAQVVILFLGAELGSYAGHYMLHKVPLLWAFHRVHHSAESLTVFTRLRDHPLDLLFLPTCRAVGGGILAGVVLFGLGMQLAPAAIALYATIALLIPFGPDAWRHCHLPISFGRLNYVFNAPVMHQIHHSAETRHFDKNLGGELMIFDWLFGTLYVPQGREEYRWGLNESELGENNPHTTWKGFYLEPFGFARRRKPHAQAQTGGGRS